MNNIAISLKNVSKYYKLYNDPKDRLKEALSPSGKTYHKKFYATKNLDLEIKKGEILGIVGKNGSGKSTLLKLITSVLTPDEGSIEVNGKISALLELGSGFNPEFTGMQNIFFYGTILGFTKKEMDEKLKDIIAFADIGEFIDQPLKTYSSGMKSRLSFAVAAHIDPEILILDEVLSVGDVLFQRKCYAKMEEFFKGGKTIIYVSHNANSVNELCTRAIFLDDGQILLDGDAKTVTAYYQKYIFEKDKNTAKFKQEIANLGQQTKNTAKKQDLKIRYENHETQKNDEAYFIESMLPQSTIRIQNRDVEIFEPRILTDKNRQVNMLKMNETYTYIFKVKFGLNSTEVSFGSQIKTEKGMMISLASLQESGSYIESISPGIYEIKWSFECRLLPGTYYMDSSAGGIITKEREVLCRIKDIYVFKVLPTNKSPYKGLVHLNQTININKIE